jgi:hypothetical protein
LGQLPIKEMRSKPTYEPIFCPVWCVKLVSILALCMHLASIVTVLLPPGYPVLHFSSGLLVVTISTRSVYHILDSVQFVTVASALIHKTTNICDLFFYNGGCIIIPPFLVQPWHGQFCWDMIILLSYVMAFVLG